MAKENFRWVNTKFWDDNYIISLDPSEKLLFLYFITNPLTNLTGIYEISFRRIAFDTGFDKEMIDKIIKRFSKDNKIYYVDGYVYILNFTKNQRYKGEKLEIAQEKELKSIPDDILTKIKQIQIPYQYPINTLSIPYDKDIYNSNKDIYKDKDKDIASTDADHQGIIEIMNSFKRINPLINFGHKTNRNACKDMIKQFGLKETLTYVELAVNCHGKKFAPVITNPYQLKEKLSALIAYYKSEEDNKPKKIKL